MGIMMVYLVLTVAVIYPFADEMMMLFVNGGEQEVIANAAQLMRISNWFYPALGVLVILRYSNPRPRLQQPEHDERRDGDDRPLRRDAAPTLHIKPAT